MTTTHAAHAPLALKSARSTSWAAFRAMLLRDLTVLNKSRKGFVGSTIIQPLLVAFVFTYMFPAINFGVGGGSGAGLFATLLMPGLMAQAIMFQGIFGVGVPLMRELLVTNELEDRVLAPMPVSLLAVEKIVAGALEGMVGALIVFPVAMLVPAADIDLDVNWPVLLTVIPLSSLTAAALGVTMGSAIRTRAMPYMFSTIAMPLNFFGAVFYGWASLSPLPWLKTALLLNPLVYMSEGLRAGLVTTEHMPLPAIYSALGFFLVLLTTVGLRLFRARVVA